MTQGTPDLFTYARAQNWRRGDPVTSREAGQAANSFRHGDCAAIYSCLAQAGEPLAAEQISDRLNWGDHVRVNRRLAELSDQNLITRTELRHVNRSGRGAFKYQVA